MDVIEYLLAEEEFVEGQFARPVDTVSLGRRMVGLYQSWDGLAGLDLPAITAGFLGRLERIDSPIGKTCLQIAAELERWGGYAYHSARHHAEVATNAMILTELVVAPANTFSQEQRAILLAGCLAHDIYFAPASGPRLRFEAERKSADILDAAALRCGVPAPDRATLRRLVLATEPEFRSRLSALLRGEADFATDAELRIPAGEPAMAAMAAALSDADLLSSAGLTLEWHLKQRSRLEQEFGRLISPAEDLKFFEQIVGPNFLSPGGQVFSSNLARIREAVRHANAIFSTERAASASAA
jgi:hypothetical protein